MSAILKAREALCAGAPAAKVAAAREAARCAAAERDELDASSLVAPPDHPARPERPALVAPGKTRRRRLGSREGRVALLHALAHIEFNAIDLALDTALRFTPEVAAAGLDAAAFWQDFVRIGGEEADHFERLARRLEALGSFYGALPAHGGLWAAANATSGDLLARLAVGPMALEARGLDVTPDMIKRLEAAGDEESAAILRVIYRDEVGHVAIGVRWFESLCAVCGRDPLGTFRTAVASRLAGGLKAPFNASARTSAGFSAAYYSHYEQEDKPEGAKAAPEGIEIGRTR